MPRPNCSECNKPIAYYSKICMDCYNKIRYKKYYCIDCNKQVSQSDVKRCKDCWYKFNASVGRAILTRKAKLKKKYKLTLEQYDEMLKAQDYKCAICFKHYSEFVHPLYVDHNRSCCNSDITCGKCIRGLLCNGCNTGIGGLKDNEQYLLSAIDYVRKYNMNNKESANG